MLTKLIVLLFGIFVAVQAQVPAPKLWWASGDSLYPVHNNVWVKGDSLEFDYAEFDSLIVLIMGLDTLDVERINLDTDLLGSTAFGVLDSADVDHISGTTTIDPGGTLTITGEDIVIDEPGAGVASPYLYWSGDHGGVLERAAIRLVQGVDPYMEILVDDDNTVPVLTSVLKIHDTQFLFSTDNATDIGATGATRPKDLYLAGSVQEAVNGTFSGYIGADSSDVDHSVVNTDVTFPYLLTAGANMTELVDARPNVCYWSGTIDHTSVTAAAVAEDIVLITAFPAQYQICEIFVDVTEKWDDGAGPMSACDLSIGWTGAAYADLMNTETIFTTGQLGDSAAEISYTAVQGGIRPSWSAATDLYLRFVADQNLSTLTTGEMTIYIVYQVI